ncbi:hypothetical protein [Streptomyces brasiliensis]|uniref:Uncharacterized protein n=1 Tax=Streptomyces brasiliensis TaxID=1954 RepID=A0A917LAC8_9ACTN|nr:hypothetical protein [Streptomyces brasiliensis]GGJ48594.1 hypothetical protein GCM10010121_069650 [Streptomyces brasiliensis]
MGAFHCPRCLLDDFTTEGKSIEWPRILLASAKAAEVIALTIGKYGSARHTAYRLRFGITIDLYTVGDLTHFVAAGQNGG